MNKIEHLLSDDNNIDRTIRRLGTVYKFNKKKGFGFIKPDVGISSRLFVHWKQICSSDDWPILNDGQRVSFYLGSQMNGKHFACFVLTEKGNMILSNKKISISKKKTTFFGKVFYINRKKKFGFLKILEPIHIENYKIEIGENIYIDNRNQSNYINFKNGEVAKFNIKKINNGIIAINVQLKNIQHSISSIVKQLYFDSFKKFTNSNINIFDKNISNNTIITKTIQRNETYKRFNKIYNFIPKLKVLDKSPIIGEIIFFNKIGGYGWISLVKNLK